MVQAVLDFAGDDLSVSVVMADPEARTYVCSLRATLERASRSRVPGVIGMSCKLTGSRISAG